MGTWTLEVIHVTLCKACLTDTGQNKVRAVRGGAKHPSHRVQMSSLEGGSEARLGKEDPRHKDNGCSTWEDWVKWKALCDLRQQWATLSNNRPMVSCPPRHRGWKHRSLKAFVHIDRLPAGSEDLSRRHYLPLMPNNRSSSHHQRLATLLDPVRPDYS